MDEVSGHSKTPSSWRFLPYAERDAFWNMAIDEAILESHTAGKVPPTLRLYGFTPAAVTVGLSQKIPPSSVRRIQDRGIDVVRRPTGGRAVLHADDLTYSFVGGALSAPPGLQGFLSDGINESYKQICAGLIEAFAILGLQSDLGTTGSQYRHLQDCFMATTGCDLHHQGTKLIGSAQVRRRGVVLQHGSAPLNQAPGLMSELLDEPVDPTAKRHINIFEVLGRTVSWAEFEDAFTRGFEKAFGVPVVRAELSETELTRAKELQLQYSNEFVRAVR